MRNLKTINVLLNNLIHNLESIIETSAKMFMYLLISKK